MTSLPATVREARNLGLLKLKGRRSLPCGREGGAFKKGIGGSKKGLGLLKERGGGRRRGIPLVPQSLSLTVTCD